MDPSDQNLAGEGQQQRRPDIVQTVRARMSAQPKPATARQYESRRRTVRLGAAAVGLLAIALVAITFGPSSTGFSLSELISQAAQSVRTLTAGSQATSEVTPVEEEGSDSAKRSTTRAANRPRRSVPAQPVAVAQVAESPEPVSQPAAADSVSVDSAATPVAPSVDGTVTVAVASDRILDNELDAAGGPVYSVDDTDVQPPELRSSDLPKPAIVGAPTVTNTIEVIVAKDGTVERARLLGTPRRMPDMMVLGHAKLWTFAPALKEGQPVRYRLLMEWYVNP